MVGIDALIGQIAIAHGAEKTVTFDRAAARIRAPGVTIPRSLPVRADPAIE